jgi:hypothetical protein
MGNKILLLVALMTFVFCSTAGAEKILGMSYFYGKPHVGYTYEKLSPVKTGETRDRYVTCVETGKIDGEFVGLFETISYLGPMKIIRNDLYAFVTNKVYHTVTSNELTGEEYLFNRPTVIVVPKAGKEEFWENVEDSFDTKYKSKLIASVKTKMKIFNDILLVERAFKMRGDNVKYRDYYAKGYGLVKTEAFLNGKLEGMLSSELIKIE